MLTSSEFIVFDAACGLSPELENLVLLVLLSKELTEK